eukprot:4383366-Prymnesium_polylepis.1
MPPPHPPPPLPQPRRRAPAVPFTTRASPSLWQRSPAAHAHSRRIRSRRTCSTSAPIAALISSPRLGRRARV